MSSSPPPLQGIASELMAKDLSTLVVMVLRLQNDKKVLASMLEDSKTIWKETHALAARQGMSREEFRRTFEPQSRSLIEGCFAVLDPTSDNLGERVNLAQFVPNTLNKFNNVRLHGSTMHMPMPRRYTLSSSVYSSILDSDMTARYYCGIIRDLEPAAADLNAFRGGKQTAQVPLDESSPQISPVKTPPPKKYLSVRFHIMAGVPLSREVQKLSEDAICLSWSPGMTWEEFFGQNQTVAQGIDQIDYPMSGWTAQMGDSYWHINRVSFPMIEEHFEAGQEFDEVSNTQVLPVFMIVHSAFLTITIDHFLRLHYLDGGLPLDMMLLQRSRLKQFYAAAGRSLEEYTAWLIQQGGRQYTIGQESSEREDHNTAGTSTVLQDLQIGDRAASNLSPSIAPDGPRHSGPDRPILRNALAPFLQK